MTRSSLAGTHVSAVRKLKQLRAKPIETKLDHFSTFEIEAGFMTRELLFLTDDRTKKADLPFESICYVCECAGMTRD